MDGQNRSGMDGLDDADIRDSGHGRHVRSGVRPCWQRRWGQEDLDRTGILMVLVLIVSRRTHGGENGYAVRQGEGQVESDGEGEEA